MRKNKVINVMKLGFLYLSTVIGAGFATGREIRVYFTDYGFFGYVGLGISTILLILAGCAILRIVYVNDVKTVSEFNERIGGFYLGKVLDCCYFFFLLSLCNCSCWSCRHSKIQLWNRQDTDCSYRDGDFNHGSYNGV